MNLFYRKTGGHDKDTTDKKEHGPLLSTSHNIGDLDFDDKNFITILWLDNRCLKRRVYNLENIAKKTK